MGESKINKQIDEYIKDLIVKAVDENVGNDSINETVNLIVKRIHENYVHLSQPVIMVHLATQETPDGPKNVLKFFLGRKARATIVQAYGEILVQVPAAIQYMDFQGQQKAAKTGLIVPGGNGQNRIEGVNG